MPSGISFFNAAALGPSERQSYPEQLLSLWLRYFTMSSLAFLFSYSRKYLTLFPMLFIMVFK